jgi:hypothetical protein
MTTVLSLACYWFRSQTGSPKDAPGPFFHARLTVQALTVRSCHPSNKRSWLLQNSA